MTIKIYSIYNIKTKEDIRGSKNDICKVSGLTLNELNSFYTQQAKVFPTQLTFKDEWTITVFPEATHYMKNGKQAVSLNFRTYVEVEEGSIIDFADADINNMPTKIQSDFKEPANAIRIKRKPKGFAKV